MIKNHQLPFFSSLLASAIFFCRYFKSSHVPSKVPANFDLSFKLTEVFGVKFCRSERERRMLEICGERRMIMFDCGQMVSFRNNQNHLLIWGTHVVKLNPTVEVDKWATLGESNPIYCAFWWAFPIVGLGSPPVVHLSSSSTWY